MNHNQVLEILNKIEFHDLPVEQINLFTDEKFELTIHFLPYIESIKDYGKIIIEFKNITTFTSTNLTLDTESDVEITSFNCEYNDCYECEMIFLLGHSKPSFSIKLKCEQIEIK